MLLVTLSLLWDPIHYVCSWHRWSLWTNELWPQDTCIQDGFLKYRSHILRINEELPKVETDRHKWYASSVQFSRSVVSDSLQSHESQHSRPPSPAPTPGVHSNSCPSSRWCHPAISSSVIPFSSCPQSLPASESFQWVNPSHEVAKVLEFQL